MPLWGKYHTTGITLLQHTQHVVEAGDALFGTATLPTRLGDCWLRFFKIDDDQWPQFYWNLLAAELLHDWGKANDGMQAVLQGKGSQAIRHEHFSALLIAQPACWDWLARVPLLDREIVLAAVLTHHLKACFDESKLYGFATGMNGATAFRPMHEGIDFDDLRMFAAEQLRSGSPVVFKASADRWTLEGPDSIVGLQRQRVKGRLNRFKLDLEDDLPRRRLLHAVRSALIAADAAGSGLRRTGQSIPDWVRGTFDERRLWNAQSVRDSIIGPRIRQVEQLKKAPFQWNLFQDHCGDSTCVPERSLLIAPCGSGKTLAAWRWIEEQAKRKLGHVLFLYPTRATATEGFRDYVSWAPEAEAALMHGTSEFDLAGMFDNGDDPRREHKYEAEQKLFALGYWGRRAFSATVDQFLAYLQYGYGPMCMLPVLADAAIVIDEVHSFDNRMFTALKCFLNEFHAPVLCMTATMPANRQAELCRPIADGGCGLKLYDQRPGGLKTIAEAPRYRLRRVASSQDAEQAVRDALTKGKRVLWVVNQVKRAQALVARFAAKSPEDSEIAELRTNEGVPVHCYHSRFRLKDRVNQHKALMRALKDEPGPALGITTQVCEMSLDIDVDLLITEDCPVTSLVQRMGRCNRAQTPRPLCAAGGVVIYTPKEAAPYAKTANSDPLAGLTAFVTLVQDRELSQDDLEVAMRQVDSPPTPGDALCAFLVSGPYAVSGEEHFRDSEEFNRPCILPADLKDYAAAGAQQPGWIVPVPKRMARERNDDRPDHARLPGHLGVAQDGHYHAAVGFCDWPVSTPLNEWRAD